MAMPLNICNLGMMRYQDALALQYRVHAHCVAGKLGATVLLVEHPNVLTLGKNAREEFIIAAPERLTALATEVLRVERGGEVTAHMPGQLVVYPIVNLGAGGIGVKCYVELLESSVIATLRHYGILAHTDSINPGVWVGLEKICAIGIRIVKKTTLHGFAINANNSLELFSAIVPCGIKSRGVTSMRAILGREVSIPDLSRNLLENLVAAFACSEVRDLSLIELEYLLGKNEEIE